MIQRRRKDIRDYVQDDLHETTVFPDDRRRVTWAIDSPGVSGLFAATVDYAREQVTDTSGGCSISGCDGGARWGCCGR